jgi:hypothetical protein
VYATAARVDMEHTVMFNIVIYAFADEKRVTSERIGQLASDYLNVILRSVERASSRQTKSDAPVEINEGQAQYNLADGFQTKEFPRQRMDGSVSLALGCRTPLAKMIPRKKSSDSWKGSRGLAAIWLKQEAGVRDAFRTARRTVSNSRGWDLKLKVECARAPAVDFNPPGR